MNILVSSGFCSIKLYIVIYIDIDQYGKNNHDHLHSLFSLDIFKNDLKTSQTEKYEGPFRT